MPKCLKPHSDEWFAAMERVNPAQAVMTRQIIELSGTTEGCSICGDEPAHDYEVLEGMFDRDTAATIRLCHDCLSIRQTTQNENFRLIADTPNN